MDINGYLNEIRSLAASGRATEHSYRPALERLFASIDDSVKVINEPKQSAVGAPDFVFERKGVSVGWCEAKDIFKDIQKFKAGDYSKEQKARYAKGLPNLIYTNGTDFEFIVKGEVTGFVAIADRLDPNLPAFPDQFPRLEMLLKDFASQNPISINTARQLAGMMAGKAVIIKDIMGNALVADKDAGIATELTDQYEGFKTSLIHDITIADFADVYAETIAYGLFAARLHDTSMDTFNRAEALELLPKSNPFLRNLFVYIAGPNLDDRLRRMIDDLCDVFRACDVGALMQDFGKFTARNDPFLHFYETFLAEYNPAKRKARGVWYTPEPVVNFIVRAVDDVLKTEFGLPMGLADTTKISIDWDSGQNDAKGKPVMVKKDVHRVQILDPATGTGTFLAEAIKQIAAQIKTQAPAMWSSYVERDLIPRLHGFELLMASYAMCHMKLDMMLTDMGYKPSASPPRLGVYLTNSLEEGERVEQTLPFARWLSEEAKGANTIKRDTPIMCVIGNPPYSGESANKGEWIMGMMEAYKKEPGGKVKLNERNPKWINDDYVKFIRFAEAMIEKTGEGVLGFITNHGYLDNPTFRGMRWHLLKTFDKIYVLDLHGNSKKKEVCPDGSPDKNVFDIMQGVAIIIGVKRKAKLSKSSPKRGGGPSKTVEGQVQDAAKSKGQENRSVPLHHPADGPPPRAGEEFPLAQVFHGELWGTRDFKNEALWEGDVGNLHWTKLNPSLPHLCLIERDETQEGVYNQGFPIGDFMPVNSVGIVTGRDDLAIDMDKDTLWDRIRDISETDSQILMEKYQFGRNAKLGDVTSIKEEIIGNLSDKNLVKLNYRPFDIRYTYYIKSNGFITRSRFNVMRHMFGHDNLSILISRSAAGQATWQEVQCSGTICEFGIMSTRPGNGTPLFPLYLYPEPEKAEDEKGQIGMEGRMGTERRVNFDPKIYAEIKARAGLSSPIGGGGPAQLVEGHGEVVPPSEGQDIPSVPLHHASHGPPPRAGEDYPTELRVFDYIYGVLHSPDYRRTYAQFLKIDFPRIPYPASPAVFAHLAEKGGQLRRLHLMEAEAIGPTPYPFMGDGDAVVVKPTFAPTPDPSRKREGSETCAAAGDASRSGVGRVYINRTDTGGQYFDNVPQIAWEFHIGGYQPAQKWLKDRKGRALSFDDVMHYQKIIKILTETARIMATIQLDLSGGADVSLPS